MSLRSATVKLEEYIRGAQLQDTVAIFDWDDTLFPSSWILEKYMEKRQPMPVTNEDLEYLRLGEERAFAMVQEARAAGHTFIVTNANAQGWVQDCLDWYGQFGPVAPDGRRGYQWVKDVPLIYAKFVYGVFMGQAVVSTASLDDWKALTFKEIARVVQKRGSLELWSSMGDKNWDLVVPEAVSSAKASAQLFKLIDTTSYNSRPIPPQLWQSELDAILAVYSDALRSGGTLSAKATVDRGLTAQVVLSS